MAEIVFYLDLQAESCLEARQAAAVVQVFLQMALAEQLWELVEPVALAAAVVGLETEQ
jgi:hypothetical protein